ncbi:hypothetical protein K1W69_05365 [Hoeflea sp. WL0058]|uniref:Uncharacterized protein n=1 Tax=Flavimaribacter sediminis TaxID=2865987 RepID=A0AAE2ZL14_9HYPH|nr:hypothetical protein [Flavimaribacter sediminis]MBW8636612.1 hypothetical protein [Flavimaribacter sediminis]
MKNRLARARFASRFLVCGFDAQASQGVERSAFKGLRLSLIFAKDDAFTRSPV